MVTSFQSPKPRDDNFAIWGRPDDISGGVNFANESIFIAVLLVCSFHAQLLWERPPKQLTEHVGINGKLRDTGISADNLHA